MHICILSERTIRRREALLFNVMVNEWSAVTNGNTGVEGVASLEIFGESWVDFNAVRVVPHVQLTCGLLWV